jgi:hypothetical protein
MTPKQKGLESAARVYSDCACNRMTMINCDNPTVKQIVNHNQASAKAIIAAYLRELDHDA